jgi:hypothetical protein
MPLKYAMIPSIDEVTSKSQSIEQNPRNSISVLHQGPVTSSSDEDWLGDDGPTFILRIIDVKSFFTIVLDVAANISS